MWRHLFRGALISLGRHLDGKAIDALPLGYCRIIDFKDGTYGWHVPYDDGKPIGWWAPSHDNNELH